MSFARAFLFFSASYSTVHNLGQGAFLFFPLGRLAGALYLRFGR
jgi:hypothetical protein